jgi:hypothetical protein
MGTLAGQELLRQPLDDLPLGRARVLRLVHQHMVQAFVELEEHPFLAAGRGEQAAGVLDQVVEIEQRAAALQLLVLADHGMAQAEEGCRAPGVGQGLDAVVEAKEAGLLHGQDREAIIDIALRAELLPALAFLREERGLVLFEIELTL